MRKMANKNKGDIFCCASILNELVRNTKDKKEVGRDIDEFELGEYVVQNREYFEHCGFNESHRDVARYIEVRRII